jgi:hypothetical protein
MTRKQYNELIGVQSGVTGQKQSQVSHSDSVFFFLLFFSFCFRFSFSFFCSGSSRILPSNSARRSIPLALLVLIRLEPELQIPMVMP